MKRKIFLIFPLILLFSLFVTFLSGNEGFQVEGIIDTINAEESYILIDVHSELDNEGVFKVEIDKDTKYYDDDGKTIISLSDMVIGQKIIVYGEEVEKFIQATIIEKKKYSKKDAIDKLAEFKEDEKIIFVFFDISASELAQKSIIDKLTSVTNMELEFVPVEKTKNYEYENIFNIEKYPFYVIYDKGKIKEKSSDINEIIRYFE